MQIIAFLQQGRALLVHLKALCLDLFPYRSPLAPTRGFRFFREGRACERVTFRYNDEVNVMLTSRKRPQASAAVLLGRDAGACMTPSPSPAVVTAHTYCRSRSPQMTAHSCQPDDRGREQAMIDRLITIIIVAALIAWCVLAVHYHWSMQSTQRRGVENPTARASRSA
jgi:hypothetical protein